MILLGWQVASSHNWRFSPGILAGMVVESLVWAVALLGISRLIDLGFSYLEQERPPLLAIDLAAGAEPSVASLIGYLGRGGLRGDALSADAGPGILRDPPAPADAAGSGQYAGRSRPRRSSSRWPTTRGRPGEAFTWFAFVFRWMAGVFFAWVFVLRGFGIAVGTHTVYDILVGWIAWRLR